MQAKAPPVNKVNLLIKRSPVCWFSSATTPASPCSAEWINHNATAKLDTRTTPPTKDFQFCSLAWTENTVLRSSEAALSNDEKLFPIPATEHGPSARSYSLMLLKNPSGWWAAVLSIMGSLAFAL
jgi:hypothetical protein